MKSLIIAVVYLMCVPVSMKQLKIDFGQDKNLSWQVVNDGVMGGLSQGEGFFTENSLVFEGAVSLENNGGFASVRSTYANRDLSQFKQVKIRYRLSGMDFGFTLNNDRRFYMPNYKVNLPKTDGKWLEKTFVLADFLEYRLGNKTGRKIDNNILTEIIRMGFISNEKRAGSFSFEIDYLEFQ